MNTMNTMTGMLLFRSVILLILLLFTMFFTAAETSLTVLRRSQIKRLIRDKGVMGLKAWLKNPSRLLTTTLVGTAVCVIGVSVIGTTMALEISARTAVSEAAATSVSTVIILIVVLVFAEIVPKALGRRNAQKVSALIIQPLRVINFIFAPVVSLFTAMSSLVIKLTGGRSLKEQPLFAFEEIKGLIEMGVEEGVIASAEKRMMSQIMEFGETVVREVMVPRINMKMLDIDTDPSELVRKAIELRHSRIPVYRESKDSIAGILYVKDLLPYLTEGREIDIEKILRKPYFIPELKKIGDLLKEFRQGREHIAVTVDEYGVPVGLVTIEDIVEEITGEIFDEYDIRKERIQKISDNKWEINAVEDLDKINDVIGAELPEDQYDSLGGLITGELGRVPAEGEEFEYSSCSMKVVKASPTRVLKVILEFSGPGPRGDFSGK